MKAEEAPSCREQRAPGAAPAPFPVCAGCGWAIRDRFLLRVMERPWHERCCRCCRCLRPLRGRCFSRRRRLYCRPDYRRLFPARCSSCGSRLGRGQRVQRVQRRLFHPRCLRCRRCRRPLRRGDRFVLRAGEIFCATECATEHGDEHAQEPAPEDSQHSQDSQDSQNSRNSQNSPGKGPRRARTVLSWQQRRAFRASFLVSAKPCRKVREALAAETGLTPRVVQVWFQNQRAKMKKLARRQQQLENSRGEIPGGNEDGEGPFPFSRIPPPPEPTGLGLELGTFRPHGSQGIFQQLPGAAWGSSGEENSQQLLLGIPRIPGIPGIPGAGNLGIPGIPGAGNLRIPRIPGIPGIPHPGNPIGRLFSMHSSDFAA